MAERIQAAKAAQLAHSSVLPPAADGDTMSCGSLDLRFAALTATASSSAASSPAQSSLHLSPTSPAQTLHGKLQQMHSLIEQWGFSIWNAQKAAGSNVIAQGVQQSASLIPCSDQDYVMQKGLMVANLLFLKNLTTEAMASLAAVQSSSPVAATVAASSSSSLHVRSFCQCKSQTPCSSRHCKCVASGGRCSSLCSCKGKCINNNVPASRLVGIESNPVGTSRALYCIAIGYFTRLLFFSSSVFLSRDHRYRSTI